MSLTYRAPFLGQDPGNRHYAPPLLTELPDASPGALGSGSGPASLGDFGEEDSLLLVSGEVSDHAPNGADRQAPAVGDLAIGMTFQEVRPADLVASLLG